MLTFIRAILSSVFIAMSMQPVYADGISSAQKVYQNVNHSIFMVFETNKSDPTKVVAYGSGVAVSKNIIATNCHVALKADTSFIKIDKKFQPATLIYKDEADDVCLLKIPEKTLSAVSFRAASSVNIGEEVFTIGSPRGYEKSISRGIISNKIKFKDTAILQTDASISPGSSGGGLFDTRSHLIGMTFLKNESTGAEGIGFAVPAEIIKALVTKARTAAVST